MAVFFSDCLGSSQDDNSFSPKGIQITVYVIYNYYINIMVYIYIATNIHQGYRLLQQIMVDMNIFRSSIVSKIAVPMTHLTHTIPPPRMPGLVDEFKVITAVKVCKSFMFSQNWNLTWFEPNMKQIPNQSKMRHLLQHRGVFTRRNLLSTERSLWTHHRSR